MNRQIINFNKIDIHGIPPEGERAFYQDECLFISNRRIIVGGVVYPRSQLMNAYRKQHRRRERWAIYIGVPSIAAALLMVWYLIDDPKNSSAYISTGAIFLLIGGISLRQYFQYLRMPDANDVCLNTLSGQIVIQCQDRHQSAVILSAIHDAIRSN